MNFEDYVVSRGRGLAHFESRFGSIQNLIESHIDTTGRRAKILEIGCGYASLLLELNARFGASVSCVGINRFYTNGNFCVVKRNRRRLVSEGRFTRSKLPLLLICDVSNGLPFKPESFDFVVSQTAWKYFGNKMGVLLEVTRVLSRGGYAIIDLYGDPSSTTDASLVQASTCPPSMAKLTTDAAARIVGYQVAGSPPCRHLTFHKETIEPKVDFVHECDIPMGDEITSIYSSMSLISV